MSGRKGARWNAATRAASMRDAIERALDLPERARVWTASGALMPRSGEVFGVAYVVRADGSVVYARHAGRERMSFGSDRAMPRRAPRLSDGERVVRVSHGTRGGEGTRYASDVRGVTTLARVALDTRDTSRSARVSWSEGIRVSARDMRDAYGARERDPIVALLDACEVPDDEPSERASLAATWERAGG